MSDYIEPMRRAFGFKLIPLALPDQGYAFIRFLQFASGNSPEALRLQQAWATQAGKVAFSPLATPEESGEYIDWLISTEWGEQPAAANDAHSVH